MELLAKIKDALDEMYTAEKDTVTALIGTLSAAAECCSGSEYATADFRKAQENTGSMENLAAMHKKLN